MTDELECAFIRGLLAQMQQYSYDESMKTTCCLSFLFLNILWSTYVQFEL
jgi:hypothetical protein